MIMNMINRMNEIIFQTGFYWRACENRSHPSSPLKPLPPSPTTVANQAKIERLQEKNKRRKEEIKELRAQQARAASREVELQEWVDFLENRVSEIDAEKCEIELHLIHYQKCDRRQKELARSSVLHSDRAV